MNGTEPLPDSSEAARRAFPYPGFRGDRLPLIRRLRTAYDAGRRAGLKEAEKIALAAQTYDLVEEEEEAKDARARLIAGRIHAASKTVSS